VRGLCCLLLLLLLLLRLAGAPFSGVNHTARHPCALLLWRGFLQADQAAVLLQAVPISLPIVPLVLHQLLLTIEVPF
jgi:hypothetical protein